MPDTNGQPVKGVEDAFIVVDDLPPEDKRTSGPRGSQWDARLERVVKEVEPGKHVCIRTYRNRNAASAAAVDLRRRFGNTPDAYGFTFALRTVKQGNEEKRGLFVTYEPTKIKKGVKATQDAFFADWKAKNDERLRVSAQKRADKKQAESTSAGK